MTLVIKTYKLHIKGEINYTKQTTGVIMIKSAAKKTLLGTLGAASLLVAGTQVAHADTVKVQSGDTVWAYSQKYHVSIDSIVKANKLADANLIIAGHALNIPGVSTSDASQTSTAASTATTSTATSAAAQATTQSSAAASSVASSSAVSSSSAATNATSTVTSTTGTSSASSNQQNNDAAQAPSTQTSAARGAGVATALAIANGSTPYVYGGNELSGFDCSGLVQYAYGLSARTTVQQAKLGAHNYNVQNAPYGALLFWGPESAPYHVAISLGNGTYVAAQNSQKGIGVFSQTYWKPSFYINY